MREVRLATSSLSRDDATNHCGKVLTRPPPASAWMTDGADAPCGSVVGGCETLAVCPTWLVPGPATRVTAPTSMGVCVVLKPEWERRSYMSQESSRRPSAAAAVPWPLHSHSGAKASLHSEAVGAPR